MSSNRKAVADVLKEAAAYLFFRYRYAVTYELGVEAWGRRRADLVAVKLSGHIVIGETKSSLQDFKTDHKWVEYPKYADQFYFVFPPSLWDKIRSTPELMRRLKSPFVGVIILHKDGYARIVKRSKVRPLSSEIRIPMLARIGWRAGDLSKRTRRARQRLYLPE